MRDFMTVEEVNDQVDFINLAITYKTVDSKSREDMEKVCSKGGFNIDNLTSNIQIHSDIINIIDKSNIGSKSEGDSLITNLKEVPLLVFTADCVPIALIDSKNKAIGLVHAGWRGTYDEIVKKTILKMQNKYNTSPKDVICVIGPSIGPCCYEVSQELVEKFNTNFTNYDQKFYTIEGGRYKLDLWKINEYSLLSSGVEKENIINLRLCTSCKCEEFHSYRAHNKTPKRVGMLLQVK